MKKIFVLLLAALLPSLASANITNSASATYKDATGASYTATSNAVVLTVITVPNITLTESVSPTTAKSGDTVTYTITYSNAGGDALSANLTDTLPAGVTLVAGSITGGGTASGSVITWALGSLAAGASASVSFQVKVN